ncbi:MAG: O-antigen ligase family protein [Bdellovibrionales bacterium]|nr:O-antigen ligase family protein [Bdellovibrionales bacterium]
MITEPSEHLPLISKDGHGGLLVIEALSLFATTLFLLLRDASRRSNIFATRWPRAMRAGLILGTLILFAYFLDGMGGRLVLLAATYAAGFAISVLSPVTAICLFVANLFLRPWELIEDNELLLAMPRTLFYVAVGSWLFRCYRTGQWRLRWHPLCTLLFTFATWLLISTFKRSDPSEAFSLFFDLFFKILTIFFLLVQIIDDEDATESLRGTFIISALGLGALGFFKKVIMPETGERLSLFGLLGDPNDIASVLVLMIPLLASVGLRYRPRFLMVPLVATALAFSTVVIWFSQSRGAILSFFAMLGAFLYTRMRFRHRWAKWVLMLALAGMSAGAFKFLKRSEGDLEGSSQSRLIYWKTAVRMAARNPLLGVGFEGFPSNYESYSPDLRYETGYRTAHSSWLLVLAESGWLGALLFISLFGWTLRMAWQHRLRQPELFIAGIGYGVAMSFLSHSYTLTPYFFVALVLAHGLNENQSPATEI